MAFKAHSPLLFLLFIQVILLPSATPSPTVQVNPFSPKASLLRHWSRLFPSVDIPTILLTKSSPLNASQLATFASYLDSHTLRDHLPSFCSAADLFCDLKAPANITHDLTTDADFQSYNNKQFKRYQVGGDSGGDNFQNYSVGANLGRDSFVRYGKDGNAKLQSFGNYELNTNVASSRFNNYDDGSNGILSNFRSYSEGGNVERQDFKAYGRDSNGLLDTFSSYSENSNVIDNGFHNYFAGANAGSPTFSNYASSSNVVTNEFNSYDDDGNGNVGSFNSYADSTNSATNDFKAYSGNGNGGLETFNTYGSGASQPENTFTTYGRGANGPLEQFSNYGNSSNPSTSNFVEYNRDAPNSGIVTFSEYSGPQNTTSFKQYFQSTTTFSDYRNLSSSSSSAVEAGKFFRQENLIAGKKIPFPDIRDKMPKRSFLPHSLAEKFPFSTTKLPELVEVFGSGTMQSTMAHTISECERPAVKDETKHCVVSIEDMAQFASTVLGKTASVSTTASTVGSGKKVVVGKVVGRNGGKETRSVSCHQSLFPYLVYYCHMVPRVTVYDVELLVEGEVPSVNNAVAICHQDTSQWSAKHAAFVALGPAPGKIEVCHFIYENDFIWVARD